MTAPTYIPRADSLASQCIAFFKSNPDEELLLDDITEKFVCTRGNIHTLLKPACDAGLLLRDKNAEEDWVYRPGHALQAHAHQVPAAMPRSAPTPKGFASTRHLVDIDALQVDDDVPYLAMGVKGACKWDGLFAKLAKPGQSIAIPLQIKGALAAEAGKRNKLKRGTYKVGLTSADTARIWKIA